MEKYIDYLKNTGEDYLLKSNDKDEISEKMTTLIDIYRNKK